MLPKIQGITSQSQLVSKNSQSNPLFIKIQSNNKNKRAPSQNFRISTKKNKKYDSPSKMSTTLSSFEDSEESKESKNNKVSNRIKSFGNLPSFKPNFSSVLPATSSRTSKAQKLTKPIPSSLQSFTSLSQAIKNRKRRSQSKPANKPPQPKKNPHLAAQMASYDLQTDSAIFSKIGVSTLAGIDQNKRKTNQDATMLELQICQKPEAALMGVFDGHGTTGHFVSSFLIQRSKSKQNFNF